MAKALLIPVTGPLEEVELVPDSGAQLDQLQGLVGGYIQAVPLPEQVTSDATAYINEEGKLEGLPLNRRASIFMMGALMTGDFIVGPFLLCGFDPERGVNTNVPDDVVERARIVEDAWLGR